MSETSKNSKNHFSAILDHGSNMTPIFCISICCFCRKTTKFGFIVSFCSEDMTIDKNNEMLKSPEASITTCLSAVL